MGRLSLIKGGRNRERSMPLSRETLLQKIYEANNALGIIEDVPSLLNKVCEICLVMGHCESVSIFSVEGRALRFQTSLNPTFPGEGESARFFRMFLLPLDSSTIAGHCAVSQEIINIDDLAKLSPDAEFAGGYTLQRAGYIYKSVLAIPLLDAHKNVLGVMELANHVGSYGDIAPFPAELHEYLKVLGTQVGTVLKSVQQTQDLKRSWTETVLRFVKASESRDPETGGHVERIGLYSSMLYQKLGYSDEACEVIRMAAMLHDLGKLSVPDAILKKPGRLTPEERKVMQQHAMAGYRMLAMSESPMLQMGAVVACTHHEKWDGSGYPQGLKGEEIPLVGRIVALVDVFDALSSKRCYKEAWPLEDVLATIREDSGKHFDPTLVELFSENLLTVLQIFHDFSNDRYLPTPERETHDRDELEEDDEELKPDLTLPQVG